MSGLVSYNSSDEGEKGDDYEQSNYEASTQLKHTNSKLSPLDEPFGLRSIYPINESEIQIFLPADAGSVGPLGPSSTNVSEDEPELTSQSPYSANRSLLHDLTLPTYPNLDIPPSPAGSPPPGMDQKFEHFLELKKQGVHFNEKLGRSTALKNPSLHEKLMTFAGLGQGDQYVTTLSKDLWEPEGYPPCAYKEQLVETQQAISNRREEERSRLQRDCIEFIPGTRTGHSISGETTSPELRSKGPRVSVAERVMAGLNGEKN